MTKISVPSRTLSAFLFSVVGIFASIHHPLRAAPSALSLPEIPSARELCTSSTGFTNTCLSASLRYRCLNYGNFSVLNARAIWNCSDSVTELVKLTDLIQVPISEDERSPDDPVEESGLLLKQVLFRTDLEAIFDRHETASLFRAAETDMQNSVRFGREHNLWDSIFRETGFDRRATLRFIAEAIQDTSFGIWHLMYLGKKYEEKNLSPNSVQFENLKSAQEFTQLFQLNLESKTAYSPYPPVFGANQKRVDTDLHGYLHHFYLPAFLASELKRAGKKDEDAFFAALLLNTGYEFVKLDASVGAKRWPFLDPKKFDSESEKMRLRKIYTGYVGALWGVGRENQAKSLKGFSAEISNDPYGSMKKYFHSSF